MEGASQDSLSNDGYESDDVSLPPLAETPEWMVFQSDVEEGSSELAPPWGARPEPEVRVPTTSQVDFSSRPDYRGPASGEGGPSSQDQDQGPSSSITCIGPQLECLTSSSSQQPLHEPGVVPSSPAGPGAPPPPQQADLHDPHPPPPPPPLPLLTPQADANVCQPVSICEEIRITPQIRGPPLPAPPAPPQVEAPPQGKGPSSAPRCFSRPLSGAAVMEGSPVTLEVEVSAHPEPTLTGWVAYNHLHGNPAA